MKVYCEPKMFVKVFFPQAGISWIHLLTHSVIFIQCLFVSDAVFPGAGCSLVTKTDMVSNKDEEKIKEK